MGTVLFIDTETTGVVVDALPSDRRQPHLVQVAMVLHDAARREFATVSLVIDPGVEIPDGAARVHGITTEIARSVGVPPTAAVGMFIRLSRLADVVVAYNARFDLTVMEAAFHRAKVKWEEPKAVRCPMEYATGIVKLPPTPRMVECGFGDKFKPPKLEEAYRHFTGFDMAGAHDALADAKACATVYYALEDMGAWEEAA